MRLAALALLAIPATLAAQDRLGGEPRPAALQQSFGAVFETNVDAGDQDLIRMPVTWTLGSGQPRSTQLEIEPALGWHTTAGAEDASGLSYTRLRAYHFFGSGRLTVGPDVEVYLKTESVQILGYGYDRFMPGVQAALALPGGWRTTLRTRYEFTADENPGVGSFGRVVVRPTLYSPPLGRWSFWGRGDLLYYKDGRPSEYNVEALAAVKADPARRLTLFVEPRVYVGAAVRAKHLWRLRSGFVWSLGDLVVHHPEGG